MLRSFNSELLKRVKYRSDEHTTFAISRVSVSYKHGFRWKSNHVSMLSQKQQQQVMAPPATAAITANANLNTYLRISACSYEGSLFGWDVVENAAEMSLDMQLKYAFSLNSGSLRTIAVSNSGG